MEHRLEPAPSGRARCRACGATLAKGALRFAESAPNPVAEGNTFHFYHPRCAAERRPEAFKQYAEAQGLPSEFESLLEAAALALEHPRLQRLGQVSRAPTARARCRHCRGLISKGDWRLAVQPLEDGRPQNWGFLHLPCVHGYVEHPVTAERALSCATLKEEELKEAAERLNDPPPVAHGESDDGGDQAATD